MSKAEALVHLEQQLKLVRELGINVVFPKLPWGITRSLQSWSSNPGVFFPDKLEPGS